jgi:hypothetical protein
MLQAEILFYCLQDSRNYSIIRICPRFHNVRVTWKRTASLIKRTEVRMLFRRTVSGYDAASYLILVSELEMAEKIA